MKLKLNFAELWKLVKDSLNAWIDDYAPSMGAALSYYTMFSIAPLLIIVIAVAGLVFGREAAQGQIMGQLSGLVGNEGAAAIQGLIKSASSEGKSIFATIIGIITLIVGATTVFGELQSDLDRIWKAPPRVKPSGIWGMLRTRLFSFGLVLGLGFILMVSLVVSAALNALGSWWAPAFGGWDVLLEIVNFVVSFAIVTAMFAMIYKFLPSVKIAWHDVWIGSIVTAFLFTIGKFLIGLYIGKSGVVSGFGAAGSIVVLLVWVYYSAQIFLLGVEFTATYAHAHGSRKGTDREAAPENPNQQAEAGKPQDARVKKPTPGAGAAPAGAATVMARSAADDGLVHAEATAADTEKGHASAEARLSATRATRPAWPPDSASPALRSVRRESLRKYWIGLGVAASVGYVVGELWKVAESRFNAPPRRRGLRLLSR